MGVRLGLEGRLWIVLSALLLGLVPYRLDAACSCSMTATVQPPDIFISGEVGGDACGYHNTIEFRVDGNFAGYNGCLAETCELNDVKAGTACLRTGQHLVSAGCTCGKLGTRPDGSPVCLNETGNDSQAFFVNTTPSISVSAVGPDVTGDVSLSVPFSFPNTYGAGARSLTVYVDDLFDGAISPAEESDQWEDTVSTACWSQGDHEVRAVAVACSIHDPDFHVEKTATFQVDHKPSVSLSASSTKATIGFSFPQTGGPTQRLVLLRLQPSGHLVKEFAPEERNGQRTEGISCSPEAGWFLEATATACGQVSSQARASIPQCPKPPRQHGCNEPGQCSNCTGPGGGVPVGGGGPGYGAGKLGPGAEMVYLAGGVGSPGNPGQAAWNAILGRGWAHTYSERIVQDASDPHQAWWLTRHGSFRRYTDSNGDGSYETVSPEDEYRTLMRVGSGWEIRDLEGNVTAFDGSGLWMSTRDRHGNTKTAAYSGGRLASVSFPDGRSEAFSYAASGKLASITDIGVDGVAQRVWRYTWSGDDLVLVERPDGTAYRFVYGAEGYMTRATLVKDSAERIEAAWEYDGEGNVVRAWRGADEFASGVERYELAYNDPFEPAQTTVTIYRSATEKDVVMYTLSRTAAWVGAKPRVTSISGDCPSCGLGPGSRLFYEDAANPLLPTRIVDGRNLETHFTYNSHSRVVTKTEAAGTPASRTTGWEYDATFPALPTRIEMPSTSGGSALRTTVNDYDAEGNVTSRRQQGSEDGSFFDLETMATYNDAGQPLSFDPPGHGTSDQTATTYDPARGNLIPLSRTEPLIGPTTFEYDTFNRRTAVVEPNGLRTETAYDALNRVTSIVQRGASPAADLVTSHIYNGFGDLFRTTLPKGNVSEYGYDAAGRLISIERKPDASTREERTLYTLDGVGSRIREEIQRWNGEGWEVESATDFVYSTRCHLDETVHSDGSVTENAYDCSGNLEKVWDANHPRNGSPGSGEGGEDCDEQPCGPGGGSGPHEPTQVYEYDELNRLVELRQPWAGGGEAVTRYAYDVQDHLISVTDAEGNETVYTYSDRDLMTRQESPVSGVTTYEYDEHGELVSQTDARGVTLTREVDALDRVTRLDYPGDNLDTTYTYDDPAVPFSKGRLTAITRPGSTIGYGYDRFGRLTQDGDLSYSYDRNGNRTVMEYPDGVMARWTYDFADREASLEIEAGGSTQPIVTGATYKAFGPLAGLALGNGLAENRGYSLRYFPTRIEVPGRLDQTYKTDAVGNILGIERVVDGRLWASGFDYQDSQYFLTQGIGPWGHQEWSYDRIGNRLSESAADGDEFVLYSYTANASGGHTPKLSRVEPVPGGEPGSFLSYDYDAVGNETTVSRSSGEGAGRTSSLTYSAESQLARLSTSDGPASTELFYDGRGFLRRSRLTLTGSSDFEQTEPVYSSEGVLVSRRYQSQTTHEGGGDGDGVRPPITTVVDETMQIFYLAGRPVAQLQRRAGGSNELLWLTTDHLGTPILATDAAGVMVWEGGLEPFGAPYAFPGGNPPEDDDPGAPPCDGDTCGAAEGATGPAGASATMESVGVFLRFPGQWADSSFRAGGLGDGGIYYNVQRWYEVGRGRYTAPDPQPPAVVGNLFQYTLSNPLLYIDPDGRAPQLVNPSLPGVDIPAQPVACLAISGFRTGVAWLGRHSGPRYAHCLASCELAKCGGPNLALTMGFLKEAFDFKMCEVLSSGPGIVGRVKDKHCRSAFQPSDFADNKTGLECPSNVSCEKQCESLFGQPDPPPGPLYH